MAMKMTESEIKDKLLSCFHTSLNGELSPDMEKDFNDMGYDSLDFFILIMSIEDNFDIEIDDAEIENISTLNDCLNYLIKNL